MNITDRFKDAPWVKNETIIIGGAGGIGSWLSLFLSRIGYSIILYDHDMFEEHNMGGQFINKAGIGLNKAMSIKTITRDFGATNDFRTYGSKFTKSSLCGKYMIAAFDNMEARETMFNSWLEYNKSRKNNDALFIDGRLLMEQMQILCVTPKYTKKYREKHLFDDSEIEKEVCTLKQTSHSAAMIAGFMTSFFTNHITNNVFNNKIRAVPFEFEYFIPLNLQNDELN